MSNPQDRGPPLVGSPRLLLQYIRSYAPPGSRLLNPQPADAPCRGDKGPTNMKREASRYFRNKKKEYPKNKINELTTNNKNKNNGDLCTGLN
jgi:hypothetical protein